jgi:hypothetical protein
LAHPSQLFPLEDSLPPQADQPHLHVHVRQHTEEQKHIILIIIVHNVWFIQVWEIRILHVHCTIGGVQWGEVLQHTPGIQVAILSVIWMQSTDVCLM